MSEEESNGTVSEESTSQNTETTDGGNEQQVTADSKIIEVAKAVGWKADGSLDAETFLRTMPGRFHEKTRTIMDLKKSVDGITKHFAQTVENQVQARIASMEAEKEQAILAGDVAQVKAIDKQIREVEKTEIPTANEVKPEVQDFIAKNPWFDVDKRMTKRAIVFKDEYFDENPGGSLKDALEYAEKELRKAFPDKFESAREVKKPTAAAVESPSSQGGNTATWQQFKGKMTSFEKESMADILKQTHNGKPITTEKAYIEALAAAGAFEGRK